MKSGSKKTPTPFLVLLALAVALGLNVELARDPLLASSTANRNQTSHLAFSLSTHGSAAALPTGTLASPAAPTMGIAMADFTGDTHPDIATVEVDRFDSLVVGYWIEIRLTEGGEQFLQLSAPFGGLGITATDLTGDGNLDLVVRSAKARTVVAVLLNNGAGHFAKADTEAFANAIPDGYLQFSLRAHDFSPATTMAYVESHGAECPRESFRYSQEPQIGFSSQHGSAKAQLFLSFGANRAPPSLA